MKTPLTFLIAGLLLIPNINFGQAPDLGAASSFALFTSVGAFSNDGATIVTGDIGTNVGAFSGFPPGIVIGQIHIADLTSSLVAPIVANAYGQLAAASCGTVLGVGLGNNQVLNPGVYCIGAASTLNGDLILDGQNDPTALFIFQIDGALATGILSNVVLINGASLCNVWWQINGAFTLSDGSVFRGNVLNDGAIHLLAGSSLLGRALSTAGAIDLHDNVVSVGLSPIAAVMTANGPTTFCAGDNVVLSGNVDGVWNDGSTTTSLTVTAGGDYFVVNTTLCGSDTSNHIIVTVSPNLPPVITCPADVTLQCNQSTLPLNTGAATATDNCDPFPVVVFSDVTLPGSCPNSYLITRTWTATDVDGNTSNCSQTINIVDTTPPVISCPVVVSPIECGVAPVFVSPTAVDACGGLVVISFTEITIPGSCPQNYGVSRTYTAIDGCGNSSSCTQLINIIDSTPPQITCPSNVTLACGDSTSPVNTGSATAIDICDPLPSISYSDVNNSSPGCPSVTRTWTATDGCGNSSSCIQGITVNNPSSLSITCPGDITVQCANQVPPANPGSVVTSGSCPGVITVTFNGDVISNQTCANRYTITRTYSAFDLCGNFSSCTQTITVFDNTPPSITCPVNITVQCASLVPVANPAGIVTADNCGGTATVTFLGDVVSNQTCANRFTVTRTYRSTDACGNFAECNQMITVFDNTLPSITCPVNITVQCASLVPVANPAGIVTADNCGGTATVTFLGDVVSNQICANRFTVTRTYRSTDACGNFADCNQTITVFDNTLPSITCPVNITVQCASLVPVANPAGIVTADNCGGTATVTFLGDVVSNQICANRFTVTRTYRSTDACGNFVDCNQTITVFDNTLPSITCPVNITVQCASLVPVANPAGIVTADNCGGTATVTFLGDVVSNQICANRFTVTRTYRSTDACGNFADCNQTITVFDNTPPSITCPVNITVQCASLVPVANPSGIVTADNCGGTATVTFLGDVVSNQTCANRFTVTRTYRSTDACGNFVDCNQTITVFDNTLPSITCPVNITVQCASLVPVANPAGIVTADNCGGTATVTFLGDVVSNQICANRFTVTRTYRSTDACGNFADCNQTITVFDNTPPSITCPVNITVQCASLVPVANPSGIVTADNCGGTATVTFLGDVVSNQTCANRFTVTRTYRSTDACGNFADCNQTITVFDNTPPSITCPVNITVQCASLVPVANPAGIVTADNCGGTATVTFLGDVVSNQTCANRFTVTRTYRSTDACGNFVDCNQTITVFDNTPPSITCPVNITVQCASLVPVANPAGIVTADNCGGTATVTFLGDVVSNQTCANRFTVTRTYRSTDACGNFADCNQTITVFDNMPPSIICPINVLVQCADQIPVANPSGIVTADNCGGTATVTFLGDVISNQTCANRFTVTRTYRSTDACGNFVDCNQIINVFDNIPPSITCPTNITVQCASLVPVANPSGIVTADNCGGTATVTFLDDVVSNQTCANRFTVTRTYRSTDACGNFVDCNQTITVFDNTPPAITLPNNLPNGGTIYVQCFGQDTAWHLPVFNANSVVATDNCTGAATVTFSQVMLGEGNCSIDGYIFLNRMTWTATDACGNSSTAFAFLELIDTIPPVIHGVPADITVSCDAIPPSPVTIYATDECLCACVILIEESTPVTGCLNGQVIIRTWKAKDKCGNESIETQRITLSNNQGPSLHFIQTQLSGITNGTILDYTCNEGGIPAFFDALSASSVSSSSSCGGTVNVTFNNNEIVSNNCGRSGYVEQRTYTWNAIDLCGNTSEMTITAHLIDNEAPVLTGVPILMTCVGDPSLNLIDATDNCGQASVRFWDVKIDNPCGTGSAFRRTYEAYDGCDNMTSDTVILIPNDGIRPQLVFKSSLMPSFSDGDIIQINCAANNGQYTPFSAKDVVFEDACMFGYTVNFKEKVISTSDCTVNGVIAVVELQWTATDICGNFSALTLKANIVDKSSPVFVNFRPVITIGCRDTMPDFLATDNCGDVFMTVKEVIVPGKCVYEYDVLRTVTATDPCGNTTIQLQTVHVGDGGGPSITGVVPEICNDLTIPIVTAYDACAGEFVKVNMTEDTLPATCRDGFVIERIWSAVNACGHTTIIKQHIVVGDTTAPEIMIPSYSIIRKFMNVEQAYVSLSQIDLMDQINGLSENSVSALDDCDQVIVPVLTVGVSYSDSCKVSGYMEKRTYTWVATDICGNSSSLSFVVEIKDDVPPVMIGVPGDTMIVCAPLLPAPVASATDDSHSVTIIYSETTVPGNVPGVNIITRTWTATDACGNTAVSIQHITWIPNSFLQCEIILPPSIECNSHGVIITSNVTGGFGPYTYVWGIAGEKCAIQGGQGTPDVTIYMGFTQVTLTLTITDAFGCVSYCSTTIDCVYPSGNGLNTINPLENTAVNLNSVPSLQPDSLNNVSTDYLQSLNLWPNPANGNVNLSFESIVKEEVQFSLTNFLGQVVLKDKIDAHQGLNTQLIDVTRLPVGSYLMQVKTDKEMHAKVVIILRNN